MTAYTAVVFTRYIMLSLESRESKDNRSLGELFLYFSDEMSDYSTICQRLLELLWFVLLRKSWILLFRQFFIMGWRFRFFSIRFLLLPLYFTADFFRLFAFQSATILSILFYGFATKESLILLSSLILSAEFWLSFQPGSLPAERMTLRFLRRLQPCKMRYLVNTKFLQV